MHTASRKLARALGSLLSVALSSLAVKQLHVIISGVISHGCGGCADVMVQVDHSVTPEEARALWVELTRLKQVLDEPDTDTVAELAVHQHSGASAVWCGYALIEF